MDNLTGEAVMKEVLDRFPTQTIIAVAHRLTSVTGFDRILVFRRGSIVGEGTFGELMRENAYFRSLYQTDEKKA